MRETRTRPVDGYTTKKTNQMDCADISSCSSSRIRFDDRSTSLKTVVEKKRHLV